MILMGKRDIMKERFNEIVNGYTTSQTDMGFRYTLNSQMNKIADVKSFIDPSDSDEDFVSMVLLFKNCIDTLKNLLTSEIERDTRSYLKAELIKAMKIELAKKFNGEDEKTICVAVDKTLKTYGSYIHMTAKADAMEKKIMPYQNFLNWKYNTDTKRRTAIRLSYAPIEYHRYEMEKKLPIETIRWEALIVLMKRHNLLLETERDLNLPSLE